MSITILEEKKEVREQDLYSIYAEDGKIVYYEETDVDGIVKIVAEEDYEADRRGLGSYRFHRHKGEYKFLNELDYTIIEPFKQSNVSPVFLRLMTSKEFLGSGFQRELQAQRKKYRQYFKAESRVMQIYYYIDRRTGTDCIAFYGTSIENYDIDQLREQTKLDIQTLTYKEYWEQVQRSKEKEEKPAGADGKVLAQIRAWLDHTTYEEFEQAIFARVIGQPELSTLLACVYNYLDALAHGRSAKYNVLVAAPSGSGKTETFRAMRDYFKERIGSFPLAQIDLTQITEEGFKGKNTSEIVRPLLDKSETGGIGIIWLDEFDKKLLPCYTSGGDNVNAAIQNQILTLIEGRVVQEKERTINTENTLFVACGAFNMCRKSRAEKKYVGFAREEKAATTHYSAVSKKDMIEVGASYELLGRFAMVVNFRKLDACAIERIIDKNLKELRKNLRIYINVSPEFRQELRDQANTEYGCRQLTSMLTEAVMPALAQVLKKGRNISEYKIIVDGNGVANVLPETEKPEWTEEEEQEA